VWLVLVRPELSLELAAPKSGMDTKAARKYPRGIGALAA
jgi:hypothetical protein